MKMVYDIEDHLIYIDQTKFKSLVKLTSKSTFRSCTAKQLIKQ